MTAIRLYTCKLLPANYVALCDDGEYRLTTPALHFLGAIRADYIPRQIGRGAEDITDTPAGRVMLATVNEHTSPATALGRLGGLAKTAEKSAASRENGKKGGRPRKKKPPQK